MLRESRGLRLGLLTTSTDKTKEEMGTIEFLLYLFLDTKQHK